jgi:hypothetical protein
LPTPVRNCTIQFSSYRPTLRTIGVTIFKHNPTEKEEIACVILEYEKERWREMYIGQCKGKAVPVQVWTDREGFQQVEDPRFQDNQHVKVIGSSALRTGRFYPSGIPNTHFC